MHYGLAVEFEVGLESGGLESGGLGAGDPAFRCGLPFRGFGRLVRDAGPCAIFPARMAVGSLIKVTWAPDVSWRKRIRLSKR